MHWNRNGEQLVEALLIDAGEHDIEVGGAGGQLFNHPGLVGVTRIRHHKGVLAPGFFKGKLDDPDFVSEDRVFTTLYTDAKFQCCRWESA
ncbi:hypothetical protein GCM10011316_28270 [Roseibium aquae]|uniref:Uncharacterized protein n=1 Tax=Roseibium aquae TaxID=1323746 RepID=A0A916TM38_9HYPH|nr:hypothetical protein GCM10011316_28270 [Roseibium aquae]